MKNNSNFPLAGEYVKLLGNYNKNFSDALDAIPQDKRLIKACRAQVEKALKAMVGHVELYCDDDVLKAASSGFDIVQGHKKAPQTFSVTQGALSGTADLACSYAGMRTAYVWEMTPDPINSPNWQIFSITTSTSSSQTGLIPGNKYWFRVKPIVKDVVQPYTDPFMLHVI